jgi:uncharacterized protein (DUF58 family)
MTNSVRVVLGLLALSLIGLAVTGSPLYFRLSYLWVIVLVGSWVWAWVVLRGVRVERRARTLRSQVGDIFEERFQIRNTGRLPRLWLEIGDQSVLPGSSGSRVLSTVGGRQGRSYLARTCLVRRGVFPLGPTVLASGDPFGLFPVSRVVHSDASLLVYPMVVDLFAFPGPQGLLPGGEALHRRTHEVTPNAASVREYAPGDPLHRIHWMSTARRDRLMVKEFELDPLADVWVLVDAYRDAQAELPYSLPSTGPDVLWHPLEKMVLFPTTEEYAVTIAASLGRYFLRRNHAVGLVSYGQSLNVLPPDRTERQLEKMLEALALLRAEGTLSISDLSTAQARHLPRGCTVILVTPSVQQEVALAVDVLQQRGLRVVVVLLDAASFGGLPGTTELAQAIRLQGVPVYKVESGADLTAALSGEAMVQ